VHVGGRIRETNLLLAQIVWKVGNHNLVLGWNAVGWGTALATLTRSTSWLLLLLWSLGDRVRDVLKRGGLLGWDLTLGLMIVSMKNICIDLAAKTYALTSAASTAPTAASASTATSRLSTASTLATGNALTSAHGTLSLLAGWLWLASKLNRDLALKDLLAGELNDGTLSLTGCGQIDESVTNWAVGAWVLWNGGRFTVERSQQVFKVQSCDIRIWRCSNRHCHI
jgi:hypothetical protein